MEQMQHFGNRNVMLHSVQLRDYGRDVIAYLANYHKRHV